MAWTVASDIADRIKNLREFLGGDTRKAILQETLARRAGVRTSQVSQWERGAQSPSKSRLERWAEREGWPVEIFQDGGPMPTEVLAASGSGGARGPEARGGTDGASNDANEILARFYEVMAEAIRCGRPLPPELAVLIQRMHGLALGEGDPVAPPAKDEGGAAPSAATESEIPGW